MKVKLGDVCKIQSGGTPSRSKDNYWNNGTIPWVKIKDFKDKYINITEEFITEEGLKNSSAKMVKKGSILFTIFATLGEVAILNIDATTNQAIASINIVDERIERDYLYYYLKSIKNKVQNIGRGVAQNNINMSILKGFEFEILEKEKQKQIVSILDTVSGIIEKRKKQLEDLDELVKARFVEMFGYPVCNSKNLPTKQLCEACYLKAGITTSADKIHDLSKNYKIPCYGGNGIRGYVEKPVYKGEYPIIGRQGALCGNVQLAKGEFYATEHAVLVTPLIEISVLWLYYLLKLMDLYRFHTGAAQPGLSVKTLNKIDIPIAELHLQNQFADFVKQTEKIKEKIQKSLDEMQVLFDSLMQKYFS